MHYSKAQFGAVYLLEQVQILANFAIYILISYLSSGSQASKLFNQLHFYSTVTNKWCQILSTIMPPGKAGHGATVVGDVMVIFGGYHGQTSRYAQHYHTKHHQPW